MEDELRGLPSVDRILQFDEVQRLTREVRRDVVVEIVRETIADARAAILVGGPRPDDASVVHRAIGRVRAMLQPTLVPVVNATGVVLHTNLGRAPLSEATQEAMRSAAAFYTNLEYDLDAGTRGSRYSHAESLLCRLTGAEAALLVNNNAGAVLLILSSLARGRDAIISRGQLVEIGGGFRIPDVMVQSGARLVEVGTTNRTYIGDYEGAMSDATALIMRVHASNFRLTGFTASASLPEMVELARMHGVLMVDDLGSGTFIDTEPFGLAQEPTIQDSVSAGVDLVSFSGDKLLGGPQAGIIVGRKDLVDELKAFPLTRALRLDKTAIAGVEANLLHYLCGNATAEIPVWRMISATAEQLKSRATALAESLRESALDAQLLPGRSAIGGGSLPGETLPTTLLALESAQPSDWARRLRGGQPRVVARVEAGRLVVDLRTVLPEQDGQVLSALKVARRPEPR